MSSDWRVSQFEYPNVMASSDDRRNGSDVWALEAEACSVQDVGAREAQARDIGRVEGAAKAKIQFDEALQRERATISDALLQFATERSRYFEQVEGEVVQLALSIARKVLHREAQVDPDLLMGLVRYTLEKLRDGTRVKVRVAPAIVAQWQNRLANVAEVAGDSKLDPSTCVIETELGTTMVGVDAQLKEIEQGLMDLLAQRPERV